MRGGFPLLVMCIKLKQPLQGGPRGHEHGVGLTMIMIISLSASMVILGYCIRRLARFSVGGDKAESVCRIAVIQYSAVTF